MALIAVHVGWLPVKADGHDRPRPVGDRRFDQPHVDVAGVRLDIDQHRRRTDQQDDFRRRRESEGRQDDLVAATDAQSHEADEKRVGSAANGYAVLGSGLPGQLRLHLRHLRAHDVLAMGENGGNPRVDFLAKLGLLLGEVDERDGLRARCFHCGTSVAYHPPSLPLATAGANPASQPTERHQST